MKKEFKKIKKISKKIIGRRNYKKIKKLNNYEDRTEGLKYLVASKLDWILLDLQHKTEKIKKRGEIKTEYKLTLLPSKIKIFKSTYKKKDYKTIENLVKEIKEEIKCLIS